MSSHKRHGAHAHTSTANDQGASQAVHSGDDSRSLQMAKRRHVSSHVSPQAIYQAASQGSNNYSAQHDGVEPNTKYRSRRHCGPVTESRKHALVSHIIASSWWLYAVVFIGGFIGTAMRLYISTSWNSLPQWYGIHWGTCTANLLACCAYGMLSAFLTEFLGSFVLSIRAHELWTKALLTGLCGGLSTMSTLSLEIIASDMGFVYGALSVVGGIFVTLIASWLGGLMADVLVSSGFVSRVRVVDVVSQDDIKSTHTNDSATLAAANKRTRRGRHS